MRTSRLWDCFTSLALGQGSFIYLAPWIFSDVLYLYWRLIGILYLHFRDSSLYYSYNIQQLCIDCLKCEKSLFFESRIQLKIHKIFSLPLSETTFGEFLPTTFSLKPTKIDFFMKNSYFLSISFSIAFNICDWCLLLSLCGFNCAVKSSNISSSQ